MKKIVICGDCGSESLTRAIISACKNNGGAAVVSGNGISETNDNPYFLIAKLHNPYEINCKGGIIVFGKAVENKTKINAEKTVAVLDTANTNALNIVRDSGCAVIGCSMSGHDTISVSGLAGFPTKMISLQRTIRTLDGDIIEPHDFQVKLKEEMPVYPLLAGCAVLLLGGISSADGYSF
ncbi:MAG: hypothetical protein PUG48_09930 [Clostridia bacterium]|nr:hypothetical protein [Clostridia bacterium]